MGAADKVKFRLLLYCIFVSMLYLKQRVELASGRHKRNNWVRGVAKEKGLRCLCWIAGKGLPPVKPSESNVWTKTKWSSSSYKQIWETYTRCYLHTRSYTISHWAEMSIKLPLKCTKNKLVEVAPVLEGVESSRDTLDPPLSILVRIKDELYGCLHLELLLQGKQMLLPRTTTLGEQQHLPTGIYLQKEKNQEITFIG